MGEIDRRQTIALVTRHMLDKFLALSGIIDQQAEPWVINPGASGKVRTHGGPSCFILHANEEEWIIETILFSDDTSN